MAAVTATAMYRRVDVGGVRVPEACDAGLASAGQAQS